MGEPSKVQNFPAISNFDFSAASGSLHLGITHKVDNKTKILVCYGNDPLIGTITSHISNLQDYELLREVKLSTQMDVLCQLAKAIGSQDSYALQVKDTELFITQEVGFCRNSF